MCLISYPYHEVAFENLFLSFNQTYMNYILNKASVMKFQKGVRELGLDTMTREEIINPDHTMGKILARMGGVAN